MDIKRHVYQTLLKWKNDNCHTTLEVNGARQVGKTYIINKFANENFSHKVYINLFELSGRTVPFLLSKGMRLAAGRGTAPSKLRCMMHFVCLMKIFQTQRTPLLSQMKFKSQQKFITEFVNSHDSFGAALLLQAAILEGSMNRNFGIQVGMLQVFKSIPYHMKNFWKQTDTESI